MNVLVLLLITSLLWLTACTGCGQQKSPEEIQHETANATAKLKRDTVAVAKGVKEGFSKPKTVDVNSASRDELTSTLGVTDQVADRIIAARPYENADQLVTKRAVTNAEYDRIKDKVTVKKD
ncbi:MAG: ComEA family DNA-binding protein [Terriglobales bacterium]